MRNAIITIVCVVLLSGYTSRGNDLQSSDSQTSSFPDSQSTSSAPTVPASERSAFSSTSPAPPVESSMPPELPILPPVRPAVDADTSTVKIELSVTTISISDLPMPVSYQLHNKSSKEITVEPYYEIERYNGSHWMSFPFSQDDLPNWPEGNIQLEPDASMDDNMSMWNFAEEITPGTYRVVKEVAEVDKPYIKLYAEFVVE